MSTNLIVQGATQTKNPDKDKWKTPDYLLRLHDQYFDPCPDEPDFNGLQVSWGDKAYINPPFSQYLKWANYGIGTQTNTEQLWICHHNHDTRWFAKLMERATMICALNNRVHFVDPITNLPSESTAIGKCQSIIYVPPVLNQDSFLNRMFGSNRNRERETAFIRVFEEHGRIWRT